MMLASEARIPDFVRAKGTLRIFKGMGSGPDVTRTEQP